MTGPLRKILGEPTYPYPGGRNGPGRERRRGSGTGRGNSDTARKSGTATRCVRFHSQINAPRNGKRTPNAEKPLIDGLSPCNRCVKHYNQGTGWPGNIRFSARTVLVTSPTRMLFTWRDTGGNVSHIKRIEDLIMTFLTPSADVQDLIPFTNGDKHTAMKAVHDAGILCHATAPVLAVYYSGGHRRIPRVPNGWTSAASSSRRSISVKADVRTRLVFSHLHIDSRDAQHFWAGLPIRG